ncbi:MAG: hypothetical protein EOP83_22860 [Verrucomicrobiaceae bacterium]|nr:MAG: hypothetical protein EOP83_22860 [Verrucomicrobiaceae bacterium]
MKAILTTGVGNALYHLETIDSLDERLALLESLEPKRTFSFTQSGFPASEETLLREKLTEWQTPQDRVDAIVNHIQQASRRR